MKSVRSLNSSKLRLSNCLARASSLLTQVRHLSISFHHSVEMALSAQSAQAAGPCSTRHANPDRSKYRRLPWSAEVHSALGYHTRAGFEEARG